MTVPTEAHAAAFAAAERLAPAPSKPADSTPEAWIRHFAATGLAAHVAFRAALPTLKPDSEPGSRPELGYLVGMAVYATSAAAALSADSPAEAAELIYNLTPEAGALNGEWEDWLDETLAAHGINAADIDPDLNPSDYADRVVTE